MRVHQEEDVVFVNEDVRDFIEAIYLCWDAAFVDGAVEGKKARFLQDDESVRSAHVAVELDERESTSVSAFNNFVDEHDFSRWNGTEEMRRVGEIRRFRADCDFETRVGDGFAFAVGADVSGSARFALLTRIETADRRLEALASARVFVATTVIGAHTRLFAIRSEVTFDTLLARAARPMT